MIGGGIRVRFAPSPTGHLHIGGMRSAIFNWLFARHHNGTFLLRIEDTDPERSKKEYTDSILASFAWMHIDWDEPVVIQSARIEAHKKVLNQLLAEGKAYRCYCTAEELARRMRPLLQEDGQTYSRYDGYCHARTEVPVELFEKIFGPEPSQQTPYVIRYKLPDNVRAIEFDDLIRGHITIGIDQLDDFVLARSDGTPMYNFVVVVDDADMKISHVIRGEEHIANTPKQILLYQACGFPLPQFAHLPMILAPDGSKLSKRHGATAVFEYKEMGYLPDALFNYLVRLGWSHGDQEIFTREELIKLFDLDHVGKKGAIYDQQKLDWINGVYLRNTSDQELLEIIIKDICPTLLSDLPKWHTDIILLLINIYKQRAKTLKELVNEIKDLYSAPKAYLPADIAQWITISSTQELAESISLIKNTEPFLADSLSHVFKEWTKSKGMKMVTLAQPLRIALIGKSSGPGVFELIAVLGKHETIERINTLIQFINEMK